MQVLDLTSREVIDAPLDGRPIFRGAFCDRSRPYQVCEKCVMDTTDPLISFDPHGVCVYCLRVTDYRQSVVQADSENVPKSIKEVGFQSQKASAHDCIVGLSGGVDSSFLLLKAVRWGLNPLVVHIDAGWNSEAAVMNIQRLVTALNLELRTVVLEWDMVRRSQLAFLRSGLANLDAPQDHFYFATLLKVAKEEGIPLVLLGSNMATESVLPAEWGYDSLDGNHIKSVLRNFGEGDFSQAPISSLYDFTYKQREHYGIRFLQPLNEIFYSRSSAVEKLETEFGWDDYGGKHCESFWTKFFQSAILPKRFGYDKRKAHLSSLILNQEIGRTNALAALSLPLYDKDRLELDTQFIANKLEVTPDALEKLLNQQLAHYSDFPNDVRKMASLELFFRVPGRAFSRFRRIYSRFRRI